MRLAAVNSRFKRRLKSRRSKVFNRAVFPGGRNRENGLVGLFSNGLDGNSDKEIIMTEFNNNFTIRKHDNLRGYTVIMATSDQIPHVHLPTIEVVGLSSYLARKNG